MSEEQATPKKRSRRIYVLWAIALTLLISTGVFCWLVVVPVMRVNRLAEECFTYGWVVDNGSPRTPYQMPLLKPADAVARLGGEQQTVDTVLRYIRFPTWIASRKTMATRLLGACGQRAIPVVLSLRDNPDPRVRTGAVFALGDLGVSCARVRSALRQFLKTESNAEVRLAALVVMERYHIDSTTSGPGRDLTAEELEKMRGEIEEFTSREGKAKYGRGE